MKAALAANNAITSITPFVDLFIAESTSTNDARRLSAQQNLSFLYIKQTSGCTANENWQPHFFAAFQQYLHATSGVIDADYIDICKAFLKLSYTMRKLAELTEQAGRMCSQLTAEAFPLEWICKVYVEDDENGGGDASGSLPSPIVWYAERLIELKSTSTLGMMTKAICLYKQNEILHARELFLKGKKFKTPKIKKIVIFFTF